MVWADGREYSSRLIGRGARQSREQSPLDPGYARFFHDPE